MKHVLLIISLITLLAACGQPPHSPATPREEKALLTDADIDKAFIQSGGEVKELFGKDEGRVPGGMEEPTLAHTLSELSTQAVLPNSSGFVYYLIHNSAGGLTIPYSLYRHNQKTDSADLIYSGYRPIQSVAGTWDGNFVVVSMKETIDASSDYEVYLLYVGNPTNPTVYQLTNDAVNNINVSKDYAFLHITYQESIGDKATVILGERSGPFSFSRVILNHSSPQRQGSLSSNGQYISLVRDLAGGGTEIVRYEIAKNAYTTVASSTTKLEFPSIRDDGNKVLWLERGATDKVKVKNLKTGISQTVVSGTSIRHPSMTANGVFITYAKDSAIFSKNLYSGQVQQLSGNATTYVSYLAPSWHYATAPGRMEDQRASDVTPSSGFGQATALEGNLMLVGAPYSQSAYLYQRTTSGSWKLLKTLHVSGSAPTSFGRSVAISGNTIVVGAYAEARDTDGIPGEELYVGAAYVFQKDQGGSNNWGQVKKLIASDYAARDLFGMSVAISGNTVVVGANGKARNTDGLPGDEAYVGAAYVFQKDQGGTNNWGQVKKLVASDAAAYDEFGNKVVVQGNIIMVGAYLEDHDTDGNGSLENNAGAVYAFAKDQGGSNTWGEMKKLVTGYGTAGDAFGSSIAISGDFMVVGAYSKSRDVDGNGSLEPRVGAVYVFQQVPSGSNNWVEIKQLTAGDSSANDIFGASVAVSGSTLVVGAMLESHDTTGDFLDESSVGAAYVFVKQGVNTWVQTTKLIPGDGKVNAYFGTSVAVSGNRVAVGAMQVGAVYTFE